MNMPLIIPKHGTLPRRFGHIGGTTEHPRFLHFADYVVGSVQHQQRKATPTLSGKRHQQPPPPPPPPSPPPPSILPPPPATLDILPRVFTAFGSTNVGALFPIDHNDYYNDCVKAAEAHADTIWDAYTGVQDIVPADAVLSEYFTETGGTDTGLNLGNSLNRWLTTPVFGDKLLGVVSINRADHTHMQQALTLFGGLIIAFTVEQNCISDFDAGIPWTPGTLTSEGHAVVITGYTGSGATDFLNVLTWGAAQKATWSWWDYCGRACYAILPPDAANMTFDPGFDMTMLLADLQAVAN